MRYPLLSFNAGELSPLIDARSDVDKYLAGCRTLENMIPRVYGAAERRPGTKYIDTTVDGARLIPFIYSNEISYMVLFEDLVAYFYYDGARVLDGDGDRLEVVSPFLIADLPQVQYKQVNDVMWLVHPNYPPYKLTRTSATAFAITAITFTKGPFQLRNDLAFGNDVTMTPGATTGTTTLTASSATFDADHVGALFSVTQPRVDTQVAGEMTSPTTGVIDSAIAVEGSYTFTTHGTWTGTVALQRSIDGTTWETIRSWTSDADRNVQLTDTEYEDGVQYRINVTALSANTAVGLTGVPSKIKAELTVNSSTQTGICRVTAFTSSVLVSVTVIKDFASTDADVRWSEGAWSTYRGFPRTVTFFEERCIYGGNEHQPQTLWFSEVGDYENFKEGVNDDDSFSLTIASDTRNAIQWLAAAKNLMVGTAEAEWIVRSSTTEEPITPSNFSFQQQTAHGSKALQAIAVSDAVLFVDRVGRKVRELNYQWETQGYTAADQTALAEHITAGGIEAIAYQKSPDPILWCVRADGTLLSMTYEREQNVIAWSRHLFASGLPVGSSVTTSVYPTLKELASEEIPETPSEPADVDNTGATSISDAAGLQAMAGTGKYSLANDINLSGVAWTPIVGFKGVLEGNDHTIRNLDYTASLGQNNVGLISTITAASNCQIRNVTFDNCTVTGSDTSSNVAILCGGIAYHAAGISFKNVTFTDCTVFGDNNVGIMVGDMDQASDVHMYGCIFTDCEITANSGATGNGMLIGSMDIRSTSGECTVIACTASGGSVKIGNTCGDTGSLIGLLKDRSQLGGVYDCHSSVPIVNSTDPLGSYSSGSIGGLIGNVEGATLTTCYATGAITLTAIAPIVGGSFGYKRIGGLIGISTGPVTYTNCYATGAITLTTDAASKTDGYVSAVGGLIGEIYVNGGSLLRCYATGGITLAGHFEFWSSLGGLIGLFRNECTDSSKEWVIERSWSQGDISVEYGDERDDTAGSYNAGAYGGAGGFIGVMGPWITDLRIPVTIQNCYAWGSISFGDDANDAAVGGFLGAYAELYDPIDPVSLGMTITITNCYVAQTDTAAGSGLSNQLPAGTRTYGFYGYQAQTPESLTVTAAYYDTETSDVSQEYQATGHLTDWMQTKSNYEAVSWDFDDLWSLDAADYAADGLGPNSVAVIPSTDEDEVWLVAGFVVGEAVAKFVLQMQPRRVTDRDEQWFVDAGLALDGSDADGIVTGLTHLEGAEVAVYADGAVRARQTVASGSIDTESPIVRQAIVGLPYRYTLKPMRFDLGVEGTTKGTLKRFAEVVINFYQTLGAHYGVDADNLFDIDWRTDEAYDSPPDLYDGDKVVVHEGGFSTEDPFIISGDDPLPCTVRAIVPRIETTGR